MLINKHRERQQILMNSWVKRDQLDATCFIITLFSAQHVSDVNTSILRSLRLIRWVTSWVVSGSMCVGVTLQCGSSLFLMNDSKYNPSTKERNWFPNKAQAIRTPCFNWSLTLTTHKLDKTSGTAPSAPYTGPTQQDHHPSKILEYVKTYL